MIAALVLAAGRSRRYGHANKLLSPIRGRPLLSRALAPLALSSLRPIVLVTRTRHGRVAQLARAELGHRKQIRIVRNPDAHQGMASSLRYGLAALPAGCDAVMICLADMPLLDSRIIARLTRAWQPGLDYVRPRYRGQPGHPVLIARHLYKRLGQLQGDQGAQPILRSVPPARARLIEMQRVCLDDVDTPVARRRLSRRTARLRLPTTST